MSSQPFSQQPQASTSFGEPGGSRPRIKLTIKPLKLNSATPSAPSVGSPSTDARGATPAPSHARNSITIKPLKLKPPRPSSIVETPPISVQDEEAKPRPKIKIKPLKQSSIPDADTDAMDVDEPQLQIVSTQPVDKQPTKPFPPPPLPPPARPSRPPSPPKPKIPRPIKLKPLKEVLRKLLAQIKRKDDYAFFLSPVDPSQVPGYTDVVKNPMDFGTMTERVEQGRYRSLEQFKDAFLLVTSNAKAFNPPPSLYHSEASKIESWGLDQITRSATQVIEYETDWTIDVVADEGPKPAEASDNTATEAVIVPGEVTTKTRSPSVMSSAAGAGSLPAERLKRSFRGKKVPIVTESWEEGGHLPGFKDGIGVFPSGSEFSALMLELKLRGKRFRTKKERLKREKEGPPFAADGSLDYTEMENPFTVLRQLVPKPLVVPELAPLISTLSAPCEPAATNPDASQPAEEKRDGRADGPASIPPGSLSAILSDPNRHTFVNPPTATTTVGSKKLRHWTITRNPPRVTRARDEDEDGALSGQQAKRRRVEHTDLGALASLLGTVAAEHGLQADDFEEMFGNDEKTLQQIRKSIEGREPSTKISPHVKPEVEERERLLDADEYIRDVVYGGVDSLAYFRSLAEFVGEYHGPLQQESNTSLSPGELGMPLAQWVVSRIVDPLTLGNYATLRAAAETLSRASAHEQEEEEAGAHASHAITRYLALAREDRSSVMDQLRELEDLADPAVQIDIAPLLQKPEELFLAENEWAGREREQQKQSSIGETAESTRAPTIAGAGLGAGAVLGLGLASALPGGQSRIPGAALVSDSPGAIEHALNVGAETLRDLARRTLAQEGHEAEGNNGKHEGRREDVTEDALMRRTRLTLVALAKRAPIDRIARLPPELVPVHIRHIVPTLGS